MSINLKNTSTINNDPFNFKVLKEKAEGGEGDAQYKLAVLYCRGWGVDQDYKEAFKWQLAAAEQGHTLAQYWTGRFYQDGVAGEYDYRQAQLWYEKAAEQGHKPSQQMLRWLALNNQYKNNLNEVRISHRTLIH